MGRKYYASHKPNFQRNSRAWVGEPEIYWGHYPHIQACLRAGTQKKYLTYLSGMKIFTMMKKV